jgi:hypothetical protein
LGAFSHFVMAIATDYQMYQTRRLALGIAQQGHDGLIGKDAATATGGKAHVRTTPPRQAATVPALALLAVMMLIHPATAQLSGQSRQRPNAASPSKFPHRI